MFSSPERAPPAYFYGMSSATPDYKKLYEESLERLARAEAENKQHQQQLTEHQQEIQQQQQQLTQHQQEIDQYQQELAIMKLELQQLRRKMFGSSTDKQVSKALEGQLGLFPLGASEEAVAASEEILKKEIKETRDRQEQKDRAPRTQRRMELPADMERDVVVIDPQGDLSGYHVIGQQESEILIYEPGRFKIKQIIRRKWGLNDPRDIHRTPVIEAPAPARTVRGGFFDESVLAQLLIGKYVDHLPLYRQKQIFERAGIDIPTSTLSDNTAAAARALEPIYRALRREALASRYLQADETVCKVLKADKKGSCHTGYFWAYHTPPDGLVFFDYQQSRDHTGPGKLLKDFHGVLQSDGYQVYQKLFKNSPRVTQLYCMAHIRRKFDEAAAHDLERAGFAVQQIAQLYALEKEIRESSAPLAEEQIVAIRIERAVPILDRMKQWLIDQHGQRLPGPIGKAVAYALPLWEQMYTYTLHGDLQIDNNAIENAIRPIALGRKNWLFSGTHETAQDAAMIYSMFATCKKHEVNPHEWLVDVLRKTNDPEYDGKYSDLLPHRWNKRHS